MYKLEKQLAIYHTIGLSVMLRGVHGIGKSERVEFGYAKKNNYHFEPLFLSQQDVGDLIGLPKERDGIQYWSKPGWFHRIEEANKNGKQSVLLLDEYNRAPLDVRQCAMQLTLAGKIHEHELPSGTLVVAAVNPDNEDYFVSEVDPAQADRFVIHDLFPNAPEWLDWAKENAVHSVVINFIAENPDKLWYKTNSETTSNHPTNRGWTFVSKYLKALDTLTEPMEEKMLLLNDFLTGKIGATIGLQFLNFWKQNNAFDIDIALKGLKITDKKKKNIGKAVEKIKKYTDKMEIIQIQNIVNNLINKYIPSTIINANADKIEEKFLAPQKAWEASFPLMAFLYSLELEILHSTLKTLRDRDAEFLQYSALANCDNFEDGSYRAKELWKKILEKVAEPNGK